MLPTLLLNLYNISYVFKKCKSLTANLNACEVDIIFCFVWLIYLAFSKIQWLESIVSAALRKKSHEERQLISSKLGLRDSQPLVCFALCTGALSDPVVILLIYSYP